MKTVFFFLMAVPILILIILRLILGVLSWPYKAWRAARFQVAAEKIILSQGSRYELRLNDIARVLNYTSEQYDCETSRGNLIAPDYWKKVYASTLKVNRAFIKGNLSRPIDEFTENLMMLTQFTRNYRRRMDEHFFEGPNENVEISIYKKKGSNFTKRKK